MLCQQQRAEKYDSEDDEGIHKCGAVLMMEGLKIESCWKKTQLHLEVAPHNLFKGTRITERHKNAHLMWKERLLERQQREDDSLSLKSVPTEY